MKKRYERSRVAAILAAGCLVLASGTAGAQSDPSSALPAMQQQGQVEYLTGGFGREEARAMRDASSRFPLALIFATAQGKYLANVRVTIKDAQGSTVLDTPSAGPHLLVKLPAGRYKVSASLNDKEQSRQITVPASGTARQSFTWR
ncbi:carboxypeptidase regulatory-like domain-containing protein [Bordetella petrii]|nr:carboxypeptidase regulatory-like domain-containing protein [Bordetella petrii]